MMDSIIQQLRFHNLTLGSVESLTGGAFANFCVSNPGASAWFKGGWITYQLDAKSEWLDIPHSTLQSTGVVSEATTQTMLMQGLKKLNVDVVVVSTGSAGPLPEKNSRVGEVYLGVANQHNVLIKPYFFQGDRDSIRHQSVRAMVDLLNEFLRTYY